MTLKVSGFGVLWIVDFQMRDSQLVRSMQTLQNKKIPKSNHFKHSKA
jgi:hypothetical protein